MSTERVPDGLLKSSHYISSNHKITLPIIPARHKNILISQQQKVFRRKETPENILVFLCWFCKTLFLKMCVGDCERHAKEPRMSALSSCVEYLMKEKALTKHSYPYFFEVYFTSPWRDGRRLLFLLRLILNSWAEGPLWIPRVGIQPYLALSIILQYFFPNAYNFR